MMTNTSTDIERAVMRRVHTIHAIRPLVSGAMFAFLLSALALYEIGREVWVAKVFENAPHTLLAAVRFFFLAFEHTEFTVQAFTIVAMGAMLWFMRDVGKSVVRFA